MSALIHTSPDIAAGGFALLEYNVQHDSEYRLTVNSRFVGLASSNTAIFRIGSSLHPLLLQATSAIISEQRANAVPLLVNADIRVEGNLKYVEANYQATIESSIVNEEADDVSDGAVGATDPGAIAQPSPPPTPETTGYSETSMSQGLQSFSGNRQYTGKRWRYNPSTQVYEKVSVTYTRSWRLQFITTSYTVVNVNQGGFPSAPKASARVIFGYGPWPYLGFSSVETYRSNRRSNGDVRYETTTVPIIYT